MKQANHWNGHLLCSVDIETSDLDPKKGELLEIAIVPLGPDLRPNRQIMPFEMTLQPKFPDNFKKDQIVLPGMPLSELLLHGTDAWVAVELLEQWIKKLDLPERKKLMPLGHNFVAFDKPFIEACWGEVFYQSIFWHHVRDTMQMGLFLNDMADHLKEPIPFPKLDLGYMCTCLKIQNTRRHRALGDALATAELWRKMVTELAPTLKLVSRAVQDVPDGQENDSVALPGLMDNLRL